MTGYVTHNAVGHKIINEVQSVRLIRENLSKIFHERKYNPRQVGALRTEQAKNRLGGQAPRLKRTQKRALGWPDWKTGRRSVHWFFSLYRGRGWMDRFIDNMAD